MSSSAPLLHTIEPDDTSATEPAPSGRIGSDNAPKPAVVLTPTNRAATASTSSDAEAGEESGIAGILRQDNYVLSSSSLLWISGTAGMWRVALWSAFATGIRRPLTYFEVDDDGESYWVFESRDPSRPANPIDSRMFWVALYAFPALWTVLLIVSILKFNTFLPIVSSCPRFQCHKRCWLLVRKTKSNYMFSDRDAKQRWASNIAASGWNMGMGGIGGQLLGSAVKNSVGRVFST
ncbi:Golgi apparatus membrane protein TVP23 [Phellopilus nigrolimitatus]|nr:Golgi apparatus membrane protein TVP23 [Phellopilus nigrolimitatus]